MKMAGGVTVVLWRTVFGAVMGMVYQGYCLTCINAPASAVKTFISNSHQDHYAVKLSDSGINTLFTLVTTVFVVGALPGE